MKYNTLKDPVRFIPDELIPHINDDIKKRSVSYLLINVLMAGSIFIILSGTAIAADYYVATNGNNNNNNNNPGTLTLTSTPTISIPVESEWKDQGIILEAGDSGSWDVRLNGMISPCSLIKKDDIYFLYYIGSDGDRGGPHNDGGPRHRKLGVATSTDGINFFKYSGNPILTFSPNDNDEEGIFSAGATLDGSGNIVLHYGAMDSGSSSSTVVDGDIRLAISDNGYDFTDIKEILSHSDSSVWGYGDELFPIGSFHANNKWYVYYTAKGKNGIMWDLGLAWGSEKDKLSHTSAVLLSDDHIKGGCNPVMISDDKIALFIAKKGSEPYIEVRTAQINDPGTLSKPVEKYDFDTHDAVVFHDQDVGTWFMCYLCSEDNSIRLKTVNSIPTASATPKTVNQAPVLDSIRNKTVETGNMIEFEITASDPNGDTLTYSATELPAGANFDTQTHIFSWIPDKSQTGSYHVRLKVTDGSLVDTEYVTIAVSASYHPYDINEDGIVDILDILIIVNYYATITAEPYPRYDVNADGIVDNKDLDCVVSHFYEITT